VSSAGIRQPNNWEKILWLTEALEEARKIIREQAEEIEELKDEKGIFGTLDAIYRRPDRLRADGILQK